LCGRPVQASRAIGEILIRTNRLGREAGLSEWGVEQLEQAIAEWRQEHQ
jgi:hypothetical protein